MKSCSFRALCAMVVCCKASSLQECMRRVVATKENNQDVKSAVIIAVTWLTTSSTLCVALRQIIISIGFLIALMAVIGMHAPVNLGTFNPAGAAPSAQGLHLT